MVSHSMPPHPGLTFQMRVRMRVASGHAELEAGRRVIAAVPYDELLRKPVNDALGGLVFFKAEPHRNEIEYTIRFHANPYAIAP
jgi:hypothetical protein